MPFIKRGKNKLSIDSSLTDVYILYRKLTNKKGVSYKKFKEIFFDFTHIVMNKILFEAEEFRFPARLGHLRIKKRKVHIELDQNGNIKKEFLRIDYKASWDMWRNLYPGKTDKEIATIPNKAKVYHLNDNFNGYYCRFYWDKTTMNVSNGTAYCFKVIRKWQRLVAKILNDPNLTINYYE